MPANHVKQIASRPEVDLASYEIKKGHSSAKRIALVIEDDAVKIGSKYTIVASYVKLWKWPEAKYDLLSTALAVEAVADGPPPAAKKSP